MFASTGEKLEDFDVFHPDRMASRILDMGDILTLIEQAERTFDADQTAAMADKLTSGEGFTLEDFVEQLAMVRKLGPIGNLLGMLPGAAQNKELLSQVSDADLDRAAAIVNSMTPAERRNPKILNGSRRARIAKGSGTTVGEVNNLVIRFQEGQKMMRQMLGGGGVLWMPPIPGAPAATKAAKGNGIGESSGAGVLGSAGANCGRCWTAPGRRSGAAGLRLGGAGGPGVQVVRGSRWLRCPGRLAARPRWRPPGGRWRAAARPARAAPGNAEVTAGPSERLVTRAGGWAGWAEGKARVTPGGQPSAGDAGAAGRQPGAGDAGKRRAVSGRDRRGLR
jgi:signal recognition particle subunit SRP54